MGSKAAGLTARAPRCWVHGSLLPNQTPNSSRSGLSTPGSPGGLGSPCALQVVSLSLFLLWAQWADVRR